MRPWTIAAFAFATSLAGGCSSAEDQHSETDGMNPEQLCARKCELTVAPNCPRMPPNFLESCQALCMTKYTNFPNCAEALRPLDVCSIEKVSYGCDSSGTVSATPAGACAAEGQRCAGCTGDFLQCL